MSKIKILRKIILSTVQVNNMFPNTLKIENCVKCDKLTFKIIHTHQDWILIEKNQSWNRNP